MHIGISFLLLLFFFLVFTETQYCYTICKLQKLIKHKNVLVPSLKLLLEEKLFS